MRKTFFLLLTLTLPVMGENFEQWCKDQHTACWRKLLGNLGRNGAVVAAPTEYTPGQNYSYHWVRDAALTMSEVVRQRQSLAQGDFQDLMDRYLGFCETTQRTAGPNLGEPKYFLNGEVFSKPWNRPQDDGPALRVLSLLDYLASGSASPNAQDRVVTVVRKDLGYLVQHGDEASYDLWEEQKGHHFFTHYSQWLALQRGGEWLQAHGQSGAAALSAASSMRERLLEFHQGGEIHSWLENPERADISVLLVLLYLDGPLAEDDSVQTFWRLRQRFLKEYPLNQGGPRDADGVLLEPGLGRYPGDIYDGSGTSLANPWFLATAAGAEYCFRLSREVPSLNQANHDLLQLAFQRGGGQGAVSNGDRETVAKGLKVLGEAYLRRIRLHGGPDGSLSEQFHRKTGFMVGAPCLTWSYVALLRALDAR